MLALTGIRSEYDILYPVLRRLKMNRAFDLRIVVSGAHLSDWHGGTVKKIRKDGFKIVDRIDSLFMTNRETQRAKGVGVLVNSLSQTVEREKPDFLLVVGDREESIACGIVGNYMDRLVAHIGGGDTVYGNADDPVRFAVSKLAHIHFATAREYANNLKRSGEEAFRVFNVGSPGLDNIKATPRMSQKTLSRRLKFDLVGKPFVVMLMHPLSSEVNSAGDQMRGALKALGHFCCTNGYHAVGIYPNTDPGSYDILKAIEEVDGEPWLRFYRTLPREVFVNLMRNARCLVGNSSMGILEAPYYRLPVVNVGNRQRGRLNAGNVEFVGHSIPRIGAAVARACEDERYRSKVGRLRNPYGDGTAGKKIVRILSSINPEDRRWHIKKKMC